MGQIFREFNFARGTPFKGSSYFSEKMHLRGQRGLCAFEEDAFQGVRDCTHFLLVGSERYQPITAEHQENFQHKFRNVCNQALLGRQPP
jgi:hypothetical protein